MKLFTALLISALAVVSSCSSPQERHEERQAEARENYNDDLKQSQEQLSEDELDARKEEAKDMIDDSDDVNVNDGRIEVDD